MMKYVLKKLQKSQILMCDEAYICRARKKNEIKWIKIEIISLKWIFDRILAQSRQIPTYSKGNVTVQNWRAGNDFVYFSKFAYNARLRDFKPQCCVKTILKKAHYTTKEIVLYTLTFFSEIWDYLENFANIFVMLDQIRIQIV